MRAPQLLFVCAQDGARSRMAEAFARQAAGDRIGVRSAGFERERTNSLPIAVMAEAGITLPGDPPSWVFEIYKHNGPFDHVIALTDPYGAEGTPFFLAAVDDLYADSAQRHDWMVRNITLLEGTEEERLAQARLIRDEIHSKTLAFLAEIGVPPPGVLTSRPLGDVAALLTLRVDGVGSPTRPARHLCRHNGDAVDSPSPEQARRAGADGDCGGVGFLEKGSPIARVPPGERSGRGRPGRS